MKISTPYTPHSRPKIIKRYREKRRQTFFSLPTPPHDPTTVTFAPNPLSFYNISFAVDLFHFKPITFNLIRVFWFFFSPSPLHAVLFFLLHVVKKYFGIWKKKILIKVTKRNHNKLYSGFPREKRVTVRNCFFSFYFSSFFLLFRKWN